jgi:hypothetical protein
MGMADRSGRTMARQRDALVMQARAQVGHAARYGHADLARRRHELEVAKVDLAIRKLVENWPPLSEERKARLAQLISAPPHGPNQNSE